MAGLVASARSTPSLPLLRGPLPMASPLSPSAPLVARMLWLLACLGLLLSTEAKFIVESGSLTLTSPKDLRGSYDSALANFGVPDYGASLSGTIVYPKSNRDACLPFSESFKSEKGALPNIVLVDRGACYFTEKVWNCQLAGASAVLVADDKDESLITMDSPDDPGASSYINNITIPSALIRKNTSDAIKKALKSKDMVNANIDWREALPHPDDRVEYEFWTNSNDECGSKCEMQSQFVSEFKGIAQTMEQAGYTLFRPHYITWYCPKAYLETPQCQSQCINNGRYCAPDPEENLDVGYNGRDVVLQNLRELCVFKQGQEIKRPWVWWDYVTDFKLRCKMSDKTYTKACAEKIVEALGLDLRKLQDCVGNPEVDDTNKALGEEQDAQVGSDNRGDVTILPTLIINNRQYRGKLDSKAVLKAICSGFKEGTDPPQCLGREIQTNECTHNNGACWKDSSNHTACKDTFRGRICECPQDPVTGVSFVGDGYVSCTAAGPGRCSVNNGGCWEASQGGFHFTACQDNISGNGCKCPIGFQGDGIECKDVDECSHDRLKCKCEDCICKNTFGGHDCSCSHNGVYIKDQDTCIRKTSGGSSGLGWWVTLLVLAFVGVISIGGYILYKYRLRSYMDSEIRAIMAQYMPLDSQNENLNSRPPNDV